MSIKKPDEKFGLQEAVWLAFVFGFLLMVLSSVGCKSTGIKPDRTERFTRHTI